MITVLLVVAFVTATALLFDIGRRREIEALHARYRVRMYDISSRAYTVGRKLGEHSTRSETAVTRVINLR